MERPTTLNADSLMRASIVYAQRARRTTDKTIARRYTVLSFNAKIEALRLARKAG